MKVWSHATGLCEPGQVRKEAAISIALVCRGGAELELTVGDALAPTVEGGCTVFLVKMSYKVLARRYRPLRFSDIVGQKHVVKTLLNAISSQRIAHAYLFCGSRGVGKTSAARIFAKTLNCPNRVELEPCCTCPICHAIAEGDDIDVIEMDAASNRGIDDIRNLRENAAFRPAHSENKIYIIDEVHMLTREAFNALLKTLEEPPEYVKFVFCTTEPERIPATILSRCQRFDFSRLTTTDISKQLASIAKSEGFEISDDALTSVARYARGGLRDSISVLEQLFSFSSGRIELSDVQLVLGAVSPDKLRDLVAGCASGDTERALIALNSILDAGRDTLEVLDQLVEYLRDCMLIRECKNPGELLSGWLTEDAISDPHISSLSFTRIMMMMNYAWWARPFLKEDSAGRIPFEIAIVRMAHIGDIFEIADVLKALGKTGSEILKAEARGDLGGLGLPDSPPYATHSQQSMPQGSQLAVSKQPQEIGRTIQSPSTAQQPSNQSQQTSSARRPNPNELWYSYLKQADAPDADKHELGHVDTSLSNGRLILRSRARLSEGAKRLIRDFEEQSSSKYGFSVEIVLPASPEKHLLDINQVKSNPIIAEALDLFPGAMISDVRPKDELE